jgi:hypothetical protein
VNNKASSLLAKAIKYEFKSGTSGMHHHAEEVEVNSILIRKNDLKMLESKLE